MSSLRSTKRVELVCFRSLIGSIVAQIGWINWIGFAAETTASNQVDKHRHSISVIRKHFIEDSIRSEILADDFRQTLHAQRRVGQLTSNDDICLKICQLLQPVGGHWRSTSMDTEGPPSSIRSQSNSTTRLRSLIARRCSEHGVSSSADKDPLFKAML